MMCFTPVINNLAPDLASKPHLAYPYDTKKSWLDSRSGPKGVITLG